MPTPFEDPSFSNSDFEFGNSKLTWKTGNRRRRGKGLGPIPILLLGGVLCVGILITFIKASKSAARNESHLTQIEEPEELVEPNHSAYIPTAPRELPTTIISPPDEDTPKDTPISPAESPRDLEPVILPSPADPVEEAPEPLETPEPAPEVEPAPPDAPEEPPAIVPADRPDPRTEPPLPMPIPPRQLPRQRRIGEARFALLTPQATTPTFLSTRPISTSYFRPYASAKSRAMVPGSYARVTKAEAKDFASWLTQVHRSRGLIGRSEYYRLPTRAENRNNDSWQSDNGGGASSDRRVFRLALVSGRETGSSISG